MFAYNNEQAMLTSSFADRWRYLRSIPTPASTSTSAGREALSIVFPAYESQLAHGEDGEDGQQGQSHDFAEHGAKQEKTPSEKTDLAQMQALIKDAEFASLIDRAVAIPIFAAAFTPTGWAKVLKYGYRNVRAFPVLNCARAWCSLRCYRPDCMRGAQTSACAVCAAVWSARAVSRPE